MKALAKDRDQRYQTMKELALALEACAGGDLSEAWGNEPSGPGLREASQAFRTAGTAARGAVGAVGSRPPGGASSTDVGAPKKRTGLVVGGVLALLLAGGGAALVLTQKKPEPPRPAPTAPVVAAPSRRPPRPVEPPKPTSYTMSINTQPAGAEVFNGAERLGTTPCNVVLPASESSVDLMLKKKGFKEQTLKVVPDKDHDFLVDLMGVTKPHAAPAHPAKASAPTVAAPAAGPGRAQARPAQSGGQAARFERPVRQLTGAPNPLYCARCTERPLQSRTKSRAFTRRRWSSTCTTIY